MAPFWTLPLLFLIGLALGVGVPYAVRLRRRRAVGAPLPDGAAALLGELDAPAVILDRAGEVVFATEGATGSVLLEDGAVAQDLVPLATRILRGGVPLALELEPRRGPLGEGRRFLLVRGAPLGGGHVALLAEDRTGSRRLDDVRRDFLANVSHELKTPIGAVSLLSEAVEKAAGDPDAVRGFARHLIEETARLGRTTEDVIELSRLQSLDPLASPDLVDLDRVVAAVVERNRVTAAADRIRLEVAGETGATVLGDERLLATAVHNLVANAVAYSPIGTRVVTTVTVADGVVELEVADEGQGIPAKDLDRVFERFFRVDAARSRSTGGSGLGLAIVKHAVEDHGGEVSARSVPGRGSAFTVRLPLAGDRVEAAGEGTR